jgi:peptide/nickel transport system permease protein
MLRYLAQRLLAVIPTLLGVSILVFTAIRLVPGDAIVTMLGTEAGMLTDAQRASLERYFGLDKPAPQQYVIWLGNVVQGDLGYSVRQGKPVLTLILERFPVTLELALTSLVIALVVGISIGTLSAVLHNSIIDLIGRLFSWSDWRAYLVGTLLIMCRPSILVSCPTRQLCRTDRGPG